MRLRNIVYFPIAVLAVIGALLWVVCEAIWKWLIDIPRFFREVMEQ